MVTRFCQLPVGRQIGRYSRRHTSSGISSMGATFPQHSSIGDARQALSRVWRGKPNPITTKDTKLHEGTVCQRSFRVPSCPFVVDDFANPFLDAGSARFSQTRNKSTRHRSYSFGSMNTRKSRCGCCFRRKRLRAAAPFSVTGL